MARSADEDARSRGFKNADDEQEQTAFADEQRDIEAWVEAGAPSPRKLWQRAQGEPATPSATPLPEWSTTDDVANRLKLRPATIRAYIRGGKLPARRSRPDRIYRDDLAAFLDAQATGTTRAKQKAKMPQRGQRRSTFTDLARKK